MARRAAFDHMADRMHDAFRTPIGMLDTSSTLYDSMERHGVAPHQMAAQQAAREHAAMMPGALWHERPRPSLAPMPELQAAAFGTPAAQALGQSAFDRAMDPPSSWGVRNPLDAYMAPSGAHGGGMGAPPPMAMAPLQWGGGDHSGAAAQFVQNGLAGGAPVAFNPGAMAGGTAAQGFLAGPGGQGQGAQAAMQGLINAGGGFVDRHAAMGQGMGDAGRCFVGDAQASSMGMGQQMMAPPPAAAPQPGRFHDPILADALLRGGGEPDHVANAFRPRRGGGAQQGPAGSGGAGGRHDPPPPYPGPPAGAQDRRGPPPPYPGGGGGSGGGAGPGAGPSRPRPGGGDPNAGSHRGTKPVKLP